MTPDRTPAAVPAVETNKRLVRRLVEEVLNDRRLDVIDELYHPRLAGAARRWIEPFLASFSDVHMRIDNLIAEDDTVVGRFSCSGTHSGDWLGHPPTGRRFTDVAEVYIFRIADGRIVRAWGLEDTLSRLRQLGLEP
jgi:predicted ester cyclase